MRIKDQRRWLFSLCLGFLAGLLLVVLTDHTLFAQTGLLSESFLDSYVSTEVNAQSLFLYILKIRIPVIVILWLLGYTLFGEVGLTVYMVWLGFRGGILMTACVFRFGLKGMLLFVGAGFPQMFLYAAAVGFMVIFSQRSYLRNFRNQDLGSGSRYLNHQRLMHGCFGLLLAVFLMILGSLVECYVNPTILKNILKIF